VTEVAEQAPESAAVWYGFPAWLSRQRDRRDMVGELARAHPDGVLPSTGLERSLPASRALFEFREWHSQAFPSSSVARDARQESRRLVASLQGPPPEPAVEELDTRQAVEALASVCRDLLEVVDNCVWLLSPERQERPRRELRRIADRLRFRIQDESPEGS